MSSKKKRTRASPIIPSRGGYDISKTLGTIDGGYGGDELDNTMRQIQKMQTDKLKTTMIAKTQLEMEKDVKQLKKEVDELGGGGGGGSGMLTPEEMNYIMKFPEEQRGVAIQSMAAFRGGTKSDSTGSLAPMLVMSMLQKQPQTGVVELVTALKGMNEIIQTGKAPTSNMDSVVSVARLLLEFKEKDQVQVTDLYKKILEEKGGDPLQQTESVINIAKALGMSPSGGSSPEIERMKIQRDETIQQRQHDHDILIKKMDRDDSRVEALINMLAGPLQTIAAALSPVLVGGLVGLGATKAVQPQPQQQNAPLNVVCPKCGYDQLYVNEATPMAICPKCNTPVTHERFAGRAGNQPTGGAPPPPPSPDDMR